MCHGKKERRRRIIIRNGAKTITLQTLFGRLKYKDCVAYWIINMFIPRYCSVAELPQKINLYVFV
jgi:hypothetical protein